MRFDTLFSQIFTLVAGMRTDSPDNDSAFSDTVSMLSSESSASSSGSGHKPPQTAMHTVPQQQSHQLAGKSLYHDIQHERFLECLENFLIVDLNRIERAHIAIFCLHLQRRLFKTPARRE